MLSNTVMGALALGLLWLNTLLVAGAAVARAREILALRRTLSARGLTRGTLTEGSARIVIEQVGRRATGTAPSIVWHDRAHRSAVEDAVVETEGGAVRIPNGNAMVWLQPELALRASRPGPGEFDAVLVDARKARGHRRNVEVAIPPGSAVWLSIPAHDGERAGTPTLVSTIDPALWCRKRAAVIALGFVPATLVIAALVTVVALVPPAFGLVSEAGALAGLVFFLLVLPAGTAVRDWARAPHERFVRGRWSASEERAILPTGAGAR